MFNEILINVVFCSFSVTIQTYLNFEHQKKWTTMKNVFAYARWIHYAKLELHSTGVLACCKSDVDVVGLYKAM